MYKYNLVIFCKSYKNDLEKVVILKQSIDKFNSDNIPFVIACPQSDKELFSKKLRTNTEKYDFLIVTDEEILKANNISSTEQNWNSQQIIKLGFFKLGLCKFYTIYDSDCYFITNFYMNDFMYNKNQPYTCMSEILEIDSNHTFIKNYFCRKGRIYDFVHMSQIFSTKVLKSFEKYLQNKHMNFKDIISIYPYEFNWYGEFLLYNKEVIIPCRPKIKCYNYQEKYVLDRSRGIRVIDLIKMGYNSILMQSGWLSKRVYKDPPLGKIKRTKRNVLFKIHSGHKPGFLRKLFLILYKIPTWTIKEFFKN